MKHITTVLYLFLVFNVNYTLTDVCKRESSTNTLCDDYKKEIGAAQKFALEYGDKCETNEDCTSLSQNMECSCVGCICVDGYKWRDGACQKVIKIGEPCTDDLPCNDDVDRFSLVCNNGICACEKDYYQREDNCRKKATKLNDYCALDMDCQIPEVASVCKVGKCIVAPKSITFESYQLEEYNPPLIQAANVKASVDCSQNCIEIPNSKCNSITNTCVCERSYFMTTYNGQTICAAELGVKNKCDDNRCFKTNPGSKCVENTCKCLDYWYPGPDNRNCIKSSIQDNLNCLSDEWCFLWGNNAICNAGGKCSCSINADFISKSNYCKHNDAGPNPDCKRDCDCPLSLAVCSEQLCACPANSKSNGTVCVPENVGAPCNDEISCDTIKNSQCISNKCVCDEGFSIIENLCYKETVIYGPCDIDQQCLTKDTSCSKTGNCTCSEGYVDLQGVCYLKDIYKKFCRKSTDCTRVLGDNFQCRQNMCQCKQGLKVKDGICGRSYRIFPSNIFCIVFVSLLTFSLNSLNKSS